MPKELDEIEDMAAESSDVADLDATVDTGEPEAAEAADSSNATDETEVDSLSVVRDVVEQREEEESAAAASSAEGEEVGQQVDGQEADGQQGEQDNENYSDVPFHKHPRFQNLIRERNSFREDAGRYQNVQSFIDQNGLSAQEAADGLSIMGLAKTNPVEAWKQLKPFVQNVLVAAGEVLPEDLAQRVQKKELTRDVALELSRNRAAEQARVVRDQFMEQRGTAQRQVEMGHQLMSTAESWLSDRRLKDPNFSAKEARLQREIAFLHSTEGKPEDPNGVRDQLKRAYDAVNKDFAPAQPTRQQPKKPVRPVNGGQVANARPQVKSTVDLIKSVVAESRQGA